MSEITSRVIEKFKITEDCICYLLEPYGINNQFDIDKLELQISNPDSSNYLEFFNILYAYSFDKQNYSEFVPKDEFNIDDINSEFPAYIGIKFVKNISNDLGIPGTIYQESNIDWNNKIKKRFLFVIHCKNSKNKKEPGILSLSKLLEISLQGRYALLRDHSQYSV